MAPELQNNSKPVSFEIKKCRLFQLKLNFLEFQNADSDIFSMGLLFYYMLTKGEIPLDINTSFLNTETFYTVKIKMMLLDEFRTDTESILFIDLIKRMLKEVPNERETCANLIEHAVFMDFDRRCKIVQNISVKCFNKDKCINRSLIRIMDQHDLHKEGHLKVNHERWKNFLKKVSECTSLQPDVNKYSTIQSDPEVCSIFVNLFQHIVTICS